MSVAALFCCALWGISTPIVKMGYAYADPTHVPSLLLWVGIQFVFAGLLAICIYSVASKQIVFPSRSSIKGVILVSLFQTVLQYTLLYIGLLHTTAVKGAILKSTNVFFVALIASLVFKLESLTVKKIVSCVIGFLGIVLMNLDGLSLHISPIGDGLVLLAIISYSFGVMFLKLFTQEENPIVLNGYQMALGGTVMVLLGILFHGKIDFGSMLPIIAVLAAIYAVSYSIWTILVKNYSASTVSIYSFSTPIFGVIFSSFLLEEPSGVALPNLIAALFLVCSGIIIGGMGSKNSKETAV